MLLVRRVFVASALAVILQTAPAGASPAERLPSVVSVLPLWPGEAQGGTGAPPGIAPEGSGVVIAEDGLIATAWHVIAPAEGIEVRLADGRILPAELVGGDRASDIAVLRVDASPPPFALAPQPALAEPVCAISNPYGLGLSISCGVVSAVNVSTAGFNAVEDFVQTDAAVNPGSSGGALVDGDGRLVGMLSAIFASAGDTNIGVNFAVSAALLTRVVDDLMDDGQVAYVSPGWRLSRASRAQLAEAAGAVVSGLAPGGAAALAGIDIGDLIVRIGTRPILAPRDAVSALALVRDGEGIDVGLLRDGETHLVRLRFTEVVPGATADR